MSTKTASIRLAKTKFQEIDSRCFSMGCNRNDFIKNAIEKQLNGHNSDLFQNCTTCDEEVHNSLRKIIRSLHESDSYNLEEDDDGRPLRFSAEWIYD